LHFERPRLANNEMSSVSDSYRIYTACWWGKLISSAGSKCLKPTTIQYLRPAHRVYSCTDQITLALPIWLFTPFSFSLSFSWFFLVYVSFLSELSLPRFSAHLSTKTYIQWPKLTNPVCVWPMLSVHSKN